MGFAVHVPHYLAQSEFADAALRGLSRSSPRPASHPDRGPRGTAGLDRAEIAREVAGSEEVSRVVEALERQYDTYMEGREKPSLLAPDVSERRAPMRSVPSSSSFCASGPTRTDHPGPQRR